MKAFDVSVAIFARGLTNLKTQLTKAEAHAATTGKEPSSLLRAQLADDMYNVAVQAHWAAEGAKLAIARLLGYPPAPMAEEPKSFVELHERIDATIAYLEGVSPEALEAALDRTIEIRHRGDSKVYTGDRFITEFAIPNFFFHVTTAYGILRHEGVPLRKGDFMGD